MKNGVNRVNQLQQQLVLHSYLYYEHDISLWTDSQWDNAAKELLTLDQKGSILEEDFKDFKGETGMHLVKLIYKRKNLLTFANSLVEDSKNG